MISHLLETISESFFSMNSNHKGFICKHCALQSHKDVRILDMDQNTNCEHCNEKLITKQERDLFKKLIAGSTEYSDQDMKMIIRWTTLGLIGNQKDVRSMQ